MLLAIMQKRISGKFVQIVKEKFNEYICPVKGRIRDE